MKSTQIVFIALLLPIFFSLAHRLPGIHNCHFTWMSFNPQFIICSSFKCVCANFLRAASLPAGLFPADFHGQMSQLSTCTFPDFSKHLFRPYQSLSHNISRSFANGEHDWSGDLCFWKTVFSSKCESWRLTTISSVWLYLPWLTGEED